MRYNARANITTDDDFKRDITFIRKKAQQKYIDALIKFHYRRGERNKIKLDRIKQLQSNKIVQMALLLSVFPFKVNRRQERHIGIRFTFFILVSLKI